MQNIRFSLFYIVPLLINVALAMYVANAAGWFRWGTSLSGVEWFVIFYGLGALVMVLSGSAALRRLVSHEEEPRPRVYLALANSIVPAILLLGWMFVAQ